MSGTQDAQEFTAQEQQLVIQTLLERYGRLVPVQTAEVEMQPDPASERLVSVPALYWMARDAEFVVCKLGEARFSCQFFYPDGSQFGTGRAEYDNLGDCVITLLQVQADEESQRAERAAAPVAPDDYEGPLVI